MAKQAHLFSKSNKPKVKYPATGQEYFGFITQYSIIFLLVSVEAKNQLDTSYPF